MFCLVFLLSKNFTPSSPISPHFISHIWTAHASKDIGSAESVLKPKQSQRSVDKAAVTLKRHTQYKRQLLCDWHSACRQFRLRIFLCFPYLSLSFSAPSAGTRICVFLHSAPTGFKGKVARVISDVDGSRCLTISVYVYFWKK